MTVDRDDLRQIILEIFDERARVDAVVHVQHHEYIQEQIEKECARKEMFKEVTKAALQYSIPALLGGMYFWFKNKF